ncbi:trimethylamine methyltransferase family protein, partial [Chloroflexota bacterium]
LYHVADGVDVNSATLATDVIHKVGPGGHFLGQKHTMQFVEGEHFMPRLSDRRTRDVWDQSGSKGMAKVAHERVQQILAEHKVEPLAPGVEEELERIVREVEQREASRH